MKKILSLLLALACLVTLFAFPAIAENADGISLARTDFAVNENGSTTGAVYMIGANNSVLEIMQYAQSNNMYDHSLRIYKLSSGKYFVAALSTLDGTAADYMLIRPTENALVVEKHISDPGYTSGAALINELTGEKIIDVSVGEFYTGDLAQDVRNELNNVFAIDGVVFTQDGIVVEAGAVDPIYELDDFMIMALPVNADLPTAGLNDLIFGETTDETVTPDATLAPDEVETPSSSEDRAPTATKQPTATKKPTSTKAPTYSTMSEDHVTTTDSVNLRKGPGKDYAVICSIPGGTVLDATGKVGTDSRTVNWYKVEYKGSVGYISSRYAVKGSKSIEPTTSTESKGTVTVTGSAHLRAKANKDSTSLGTIPANTYVTYLGKTSKDSRGVVWYNVKVNGKTGWVSSKYSVKGKVSGGSSASSSSSSGSYVKTTGNAHIRATYNKDSDSKGTIPADAKCTYLGSSKKDSRGVRWYKIKYNGTTGWVSSKYAKLYK